MRLVFMGTPDFARACLETLHTEGFDIVGVYTKVDTPKNRGMKLLPSPVKAYAEAVGLPVYQPQSFREEQTVQQLRELKPEQKFTQPPARYTEATLIKALEENGIGRPSTYAPIITTIIDRDYVERDQKKLAPTTLGRVINELMLEQFPNIVDVKFSAHMEEELDTIENGKTDWHEVIDDFYTDFDKTLKEAEVKMEGKRIKVPDEETDEVCELCGRKMVIKSGRYGKFLACPGFPECKNTKRLVKDTGGLCPKCGSRMLVRHSKKGRVYYGCEKNPTCDFMTWNEPTTEKCPECGSTLFKKGGKNGILLCEKEGCGYSRALGAEKKE